MVNFPDFVSSRISLHHFSNNVNSSSLIIHIFFSICACAKVHAISYGMYSISIIGSSPTVNSSINVSRVYVVCQSLDIIYIIKYYKNECKESGSSLVWGMFESIVFADCCVWVIWIAVFGSQDDTWFIGGLFCIFVGKVDLPEFVSGVGIE